MRDSKAINNHKTAYSDSVSDERLLMLFASGDTPAFDVLYQRHKSALFSFLRRQCNDIGVAEELAHDSWLAVIKQATGFQENALFKTWLYRIAHNRLVDYWRKYGRSNDALFAELSDVSRALGQNADVVDRSSESIELAQLLSQLDTLSDEQTTTLLLKIEGFSHAEIASITNTKQETVKSRLRYATQRLRVAMELT